MAYETIRYVVQEGIATVTLHRPEVLNAFNVSMMRELLDAFDRIDTDDAVRAVIVTGSGRAFCAGADLSEGSSAFVVGDDAAAEVLRPDGGLNYDCEGARDGGGRVVLRIYRCLKPVIAAINGAAVGVGATMTLPMDIRLASESARVGFVFSRRGIVPEACSCFFLPRVVGISRALEWCYSGRVYSATDVKAGGLVRETFPDADLLAAARQIAREIADYTAPVAIALTRQMMWRGLGLTDPMEAHRVDSRGILSRGRSLDVAEGVQAFLQKRPAHFVNSVSKDMPDYFPWWTDSPYA
jgi:enoyl-CoA hydratase/carnithine racemase